MRRRKFITTSTSIVAGMPFINNVFASPTTTVKKSDTIKVFLPMPIQVVIDDVGWWSGEDGSKKWEPYRTGINRNHVPEDYKAIAYLGHSLGIKPQAAMILCEWDKDNILRSLPSSTWMGENWENSKWIGPWYEEASQIIRDNSDFIELTLHGIGHEYWEDGIFTRAEWTDSNGKMRPRDQVELHLEYFEKLLKQHDLGTMPDSFVPTAFKHTFGISNGRDISLAEILKNHGVTYINTPFNSIFHSERIQYKTFGVDSGVITIDRGKDMSPWNAFPGNPLEIKTVPTCGMHWPNLLHPDPSRNSESVEIWIDYLKSYNEKPDTFLAPDSLVFRQQLAHMELTRLDLKKNSVELDFAETNKIPGITGEEEFKLRISCDEKFKFNSNAIEIKQVALKTADDYLYTLNLKRIPGNNKAQIKWKLL